ncbi:MAG: CocE/NonD family hydrolase [Methanobacterium sp.]
MEKNLLPNIIVEKDVMIPMRDSVVLATDIYRQDDGKKHPVLLLKAPYDKDEYSMWHTFVCSPYVAAERGYVVMVQHDRGRFKSDGTWDTCADDGKDTYDTVEWAAVQPWSTGNVGMYGWCGVGYAPFHAAIEQPPHLKAIFSYVSSGNFYDGWLYSSGAFELWFSHFWADFLNMDPYHHVDPEKGSEVEAVDVLSISRGGLNVEPYKFLPVKDIPIVKNVPYWKDWVGHPSYDEFWKKQNAIARADRIKIPVLNAGGWYDQCIGSLLELDRAIQERGDEQAKEERRIFIGPWDHSAYYNGLPTYAGERNFGTPTGPSALAPILFQWFDHWLKGEKNTFMAGENKVRYFQMGENVWKDAPAWPPENTKVQYYLHSEGQANSRMGNGGLSTAAPKLEAVDSFVYDPLNPVISNGGQCMMAPQGVRNQAENELREDILVYTTPRLAEPVALAGPVSVTLYATTSVEDTDFVARLVDVEPDGYCVPITEGIIRARYRNGTEKEEFLTPGEITKFEIKLYDTAHTFLPNHCIRLELTSSNFPRFDRNLNSRITPALGTEKDAQKAVQQVFHTEKYRSCVNLPVVKID